MSMKINVYLQHSIQNYYMIENKLILGKKKYIYIYFEYLGSLEMSDFKWGHKPKKDGKHWWRLLITT